MVFLLWIEPTLSQALPRSARSHVALGRNGSAFVCSAGVVQSDVFFGGKGTKKGKGTQLSS